MKTTPKYKLLANALTDEIKKHRYQPGARLPGCRELAKTHDMSYVTVTNAIRYLEERGLVKRLHGQGIYVEDLKKTRQPITPQLVGLLAPIQGDIHGNVCEVLMSKFEPAGILTVPLLNDITFHHSLPVEAVHKKFSQIIAQGIKNLIIYGERHFPFAIFKEYLNEFESVTFIGLYEADEKLPNANFFVPDFHKAGYLAAAHLLEKGWNEILFITYQPMHPLSLPHCGLTHDMDSVFLEGIKSAYLDHDLDPEEHLREFHGKTQDKPPSTLNLIGDFIEGKNRGVIAFGDFRMKLVYGLAQKRKLVPGKDFAAIGWGNTPWSTILEPNLTTFSIHEKTIAAEAADAVLNSRSGIDKLFEPTLIKRQSTESTR